MYVNIHCIKLMEVNKVLKYYNESIQKMPLRLMEKSVMPFVFFFIRLTERFRSVFVLVRRQGGKRKTYRSLYISLSEPTL